MSDSIFDVLDAIRHLVVQYEADSAALTARVADLEARLTPPAPPALSPLLEPSDGLLLGSTVGFASMSSTLSHQQITGSVPAIAHQYATSATAFRKRLASTPVGSIPAINLKPLGTLNPTVYERTLAGEADAVLTDVAAALVEYTRPCFMLLMHEPENDGPASADALYARAYRYCVEFIRSRGATNAVFVWNVMGYHLARYDALYPGGDVVDWIGTNPYAQTRPASSWVQFVGAFYEGAASKGKPIMLGEWGISSRVAAASTILSAAGVAELRHDLPLVKALVYWDAIGEFDYRLSNQVAAWREFAALPDFTVDVSAVAKGG